jgi:predicted NUDIX family NTP pyrophosphohydrolase
MGSAVMMAVDEKKRILLVRQFRLPAAKSLWELPAGRLDEGEKPLEAARRELRKRPAIARGSGSGWRRSGRAPDLWPRR